DWNFLKWDEDEDFKGFVERAPLADVIVAGNVPGDWPKLPKLKLRQVPNTGINWLDPSDMPKGSVVCNAFGHEIAIAEYIIAGMLERAIGLLAMDAKFRKDGWAGRRPGMLGSHGELFERTVGILGYGHIGREVAKRAKGFGMRVVAASRTVYEAPELEWFGTMEKLEKLLAESDYVVVTLPLAPETKAMFDARLFSLMKPDAVVVNVGRGEVMNEKDLYETLRDKKIGGAVIDVWFDYPQDGEPECPPSKFPFGELDNILMTPHASGSTDPMRRRRWAQVAANLDHFARGEALENFCFEGAGD
ncbi:MAG: 2-hydroxyacid dehydrogenase, partial [Rhodospirillaceae bacterium]